MSTTRRTNRWFDAAPLPRGANHVAVAADAGRVYALGGFIEQNRNPDHNAYVYEVSGDRWTPIAPLPRPRGAAAAVILDGRIHLIGGASEPTMERASVGWHEIYDPQADRWLPAKPLPGARDHVGCVAHGGLIHVIGGRFNTFEYNTDLHHVYLPERDTWEVRSAPADGAIRPRPRRLPRPLLRDGRGGGTDRAGTAGRRRRSSARWRATIRRPTPGSSHAPMPTPRHAVGATLIGDWVYVAGGGAVLGGGVQSAVHEAFTLS